MKAALLLLLALAAPLPVLSYAHTSDGHPVDTDPAVPGTIRAPNPADDRIFALSTGDPAPAAVTLDVLANDRDSIHRGTNLEALVVGPAQPDVGIMTVAADGTATFRPAPGFAGEADYVVTVRDARPADAFVGDHPHAYRTALKVVVAADTDGDGVPDAMADVNGDGDHDDLVDHDGDPSTPALREVADWCPRGEAVPALPDAENPGCSDIVPERDRAQTTRNVPVEIDPAANDAGPPGLAVTGMVGSASGDVEIRNGTITYTPAPGFTGVDRFTVILHGMTPGGERSTVGHLSRVAVAVTDTYDDDGDGVLDAMGALYAKGDGPHPDGAAVPYSEDRCPYHAAAPGRDADGDGCTDVAAVPETVRVAVFGGPVEFVPETISSEPDVGLRVLADRLPALALGGLSVSDDGTAVTVDLADGVAPGTGETISLVAGGGGSLDVSIPVEIVAVPAYPGCSVLLGPLEGAEDAPGSWRQTVMNGGADAVSSLSVYPGPGMRAAEVRTGEGFAPVEGGAVVAGHIAPGGSAVVEFRAAGDENPAGGAPWAVSYAAQCAG